MEPIDAVILVGGRGTRLQGVVGDRPKPMAEVAGKPFLEWLLVQLRAQGIGRVVLATGYRGEQIAAYFGDGARWDLEVVYSHETQALGTGGAVRNALPSVTTQRVLVLNGDSYCRYDVSVLDRCHVEKAALATLWLVPVDDCRRYGSVRIDTTGRVLAFAEKMASASPGLINAGVYLFEREVLGLLPQQQAISLETEVFPGLIGRGLCAVAGEGPFLDIGTPDAYARADEFLRENGLT